MAIKKTKDPTVQEATEVPSLKRVMSEINRKYGTGTLKLASSIDTSDNRLPTGVPGFDAALGGGFIKGQISELYGMESAGKTLLTLRAIAQAQKKGLDCIYIDAEGGFDPEWARINGVDPDKLVLMPTASGEEIFTLLIKIFAAKPALVVIDSLAAIATKSEIEGELETQYMAPKARFLSRALPIINVYNKGMTAIIFINQLRDVVTAMGSRGTTTPGGRSVKHWAAIRIKVQKDKELIYEDGKKSGNVIGHTVNFIVEKNKTAIPHKQGSFKFFYENAEIR